MVKIDNSLKNMYVHQGLTQGDVENIEGSITMKVTEKGERKLAPMLEV